MMKITIGIIIFAFYFGLAGVISAAAKNKGYVGFPFGLISLFLTPIIGGIVVLALHDKTTKQCPYCKSMIDKSATVCSKCGKELIKREKPAPQNNEVDDEKNKWISARIVELISEGKTATDAKIQAEAEYTVQSNKQSE